MKIPEGTINARIKLESYFIIPIKNPFKKYCRIIINDVEMFTKLDTDLLGSNAYKLTRELIKKLFDGDLITVAILEEGKGSNEYITDDEYAKADKYLIKLEKNKEWVSIEKL